MGWLLMLPWSAAHGAVDIREFDSETDRQRYQSFIDELRCPKCQNQNLAGSDSPIAKDLRDQVYRMIKEGRADKEITDFLVERYGDYVLYRPPLKAATLALWLGPVVVLLLGIIILIWVVRQRRSSGLAPTETAKNLTDAERSELDRLLNSSDDENPER
ncbi:cytochrome c-type biogenesis protein [Marinimicrobium sp. LS-A18]|uniref:cytochrome c-type biogenesis protein n=1 Tax=Marinimicrobium sp. LS-A18 TaxID=1381596 RepID=UPI0004B28A96|nr:cytochrome c-type biogenesis protein [Marinimicrobium sp. LS-A18]